MKLSGFTQGKVVSPLLAVIYGPDGVGKTTLGSDAPSPIFIGPERGSDNFDVSRFSVGTWEDVKDRVTQIATAEHDFKSLCIDSLDHLEPLLFDYLCRTHKETSIEDVGGGYGKWVGIVLSEWRTFQNDLSRLRADRKMNVIAIAHSQVKQFNDPNQSLPYDRYSLKLHEKSAALWREFVDLVGFANYEDTVFKVNKTDRKAKASHEGVRKLYTVRRAAFDAKNRLGLPPELPLSYQALSDAIAKGQPDSLENVKADLLSDFEEIKKRDKPLSDKMALAIEKAGSDVVQLSKIRNHARTIIEQYEDK